MAYTAKIIIFFKIILYSWYFVVFWGVGFVIIESCVSYTYFLAALSLFPSENLELKNITVFKIHYHLCTRTDGINCSGTGAEEINIK